MKIALIAPSQIKNRTYFSNNEKLQNFFSTNKNVPGFFHPNLALLTIAALTPDDVEIRIIDERIDSIIPDETYDIVGISMMTAQALRGYELADLFSKMGAWVVMGGIHPTILPEETARHCDTVIIGEAENSWPQFLKDFKEGNPKKRYTDHSVDLTQSPVPRYDLVDTSTFHILPVQTTRGCPYDCSFCSVTSVFGPKCRMKNERQVVKEIEAVLSVTGLRRIVFNDDNIFALKNRSYEILTAIKPLRIGYFVQTDASIAEDKNLMHLLQESGCKTVFIGLESLVPENLSAIQKHRTKLNQLKKYSEYCKIIHSYGIQVFGSFIVGFDYDTKDNLLWMKDFVLENHIWAQFLFLTPFPGTRIREELIQQNRLTSNHHNWQYYTCFDAVFEPERISTIDLESTVLDLYESVYSDQAHNRRTRHMVNQIKESRK